jgi:RNase P subunit RPR2
MSSDQEQNSTISFTEKNKKLYCEHCSYSTIPYILARIHWAHNHATEEEKINYFKHYCNDCGYYCNADICFEMHICMQTKLK